MSCLKISCRLRIQGFEVWFVNTLKTFSNHFIFSNLPIKILSYPNKSIAIYEREL